MIPVDLGMVGEIINGKFVEQRATISKTKNVDIKDYGEVSLCDKFGQDLLHELSCVWPTNVSTRIYIIALIRAAYGDVKNRDLQLHYLTSFASEYYPGRCAFA